MNADESPLQSGQDSGNSDYSALKNDLEALRKDLAKLSRGVLKDTRSGIKTTIDKACESSDKAMHKAEDKIRERPFLSLLLSFMVGLVLAKLLDRS